MDTTTIHNALVSQYLAALAMLREVVTSMPPSLWNDPSFENRTWRLAYHVLFYTHLYLSPSVRDFVPWERAIADAEVAGRRGHPPFDVPDVVGANTIDEILEYIGIVEAMIPTVVTATPLDGASGFEWIPLERFELHLFNIRHLQHHAAQLIERRRAAGASGVEWVGRAEPHMLDESTTVRQSRTHQRRPTTPGEILAEEFLTPMHMTQRELAEHIGHDIKVINRIVKGRAAVTAAMALKLAATFETTPEFWLNAQKAVDLYDARMQLGALPRPIRVGR